MRLNLFVSPYASASVWAHNPKVGGSNPPPATKISPMWTLRPNPKAPFLLWFARGISLSPRTLDRFLIHCFGALYFSHLRKNGNNFRKFPLQQQPPQRE